MASPTASRSRLAPRRVVALATAAGLVGSLGLLGGSAAIAASSTTVDVKASQVSSTRPANGGWFYDNDPGLGSFAVTKDGPNSDLAMKLILTQPGPPPAQTDKIYVYNSYPTAERPTDIQELLQGASYTYAGINVNFQVEVIFKPKDVAQYGPAGTSGACTPASTWWDWALTTDPDWCYTVFKWEPFVSPGPSTWKTVDLSVDTAADSPTDTGGWVNQKRVGIYPPVGVHIGNTMAEYLEQIDEYQVTGLVFGTGSGTPGPAYGWVKDYTIGGTTYQFAPEPAPKSPPPATTSDDLEDLMASDPVNYPDSSTGFSVGGGAPGAGLGSLDPTKPLDAELPWSDSSDSFVDVYAYSAPIFLGTFPVVGGKVVLTGLDLKALEAGGHKLVFIGQTSTSVQVVAISVSGLAASGAEIPPAIPLAASAMLLFGALVVLGARRTRRRRITG